MKTSFKLALLAGPMAVATLLAAAPAEACGGCFVPPEEDTQVTGHRMVLSISKDQSTLYDQIQYDGDPESFAWVLPIKGQVDLGVSSDLVFNQLGNDTRVQVFAPPLNCPDTSCWEDDASFGSTGSGGQNAPAGESGVDVIAQEQVGPYETVQLAATDPDALDNWLDTHGYNVPDEIQPIVNAYLAENFNFLAMKLIPGVGTDRMAPVRITTPGASPALPLRMVAAGTGALTPITLWVIAEGRYEPSNFPSFTIPTEGVVWNWDTDSSNYNELRQLAYDASGGFGWLVESSRDYSGQTFRNQILNVVDFVGPEQSGYGDGMDWQLAYDEATEDMDVMFQGMNDSDIVVTRLRAELTRDALAADLALEAASDQGDVERFIQTTKSIGTKPVCPPEPDCSGSGSSGSGGPGWEAPWLGNGEGSGSSSGGGCSVGQSGNADLMLGLGLVGLAVGMRRRRRRKREEGR